MHLLIVEDDIDLGQALLVALKADIPTLRVIAHGANAGQSRAVRTGVMAAKGAI